MSTALVIGAGPAGLMAADVLSAAGLKVTIADQMPSVGRKFLMAGKSGLNLTKDEPLEDFLHAFGDLPEVFQDAVRDFGPSEVQDWARALGQTVFTGSTGRVFPTVMKASPLLRAWLARLDTAGVQLRTRYRWDGWDDRVAVFQTPTGREAIAADVTVLALGGASWARLGSDGAWAQHVSPIAPFKPANCGFAVRWTDHMTPFFGHPVKATALHAGDTVSRGEWVITKEGIEGGGVYGVAAAVRDGAALTIDVVPDLSFDDVAARIARGRKVPSLSEILKKRLGLPPVKVALVNELARSTDRALKDVVKALPLMHNGPFPMNDAISTAGGLPIEGLDNRFMLRDRPSIFAAGEMLNWEAPTGGYLITGCLATGRAAGIAAAAWAAENA